MGSNSGENNQNNPIEYIIAELRSALIREEEFNKQYELSKVQNANTAVSDEKFELITKIESNTPNVPQSGECWALVCYKEKTVFQKIIYSLKKLATLTINRILGKA